MVVATALAASIAVAALAALTRFSRHVRRERPGGFAPEALTALLEMDLLHAERLVADSEQVTLLGYGSIGPDGEPTHRPAGIAYEVRTAGGRSWLLRRQTVEDALGRRIETVELVCADVAKLTIAPAREDFADGSPAGRSQAGIPIPEAVVVTVAFAPSGGHVHHSPGHGTPPRPSRPATTCTRMLTLR